MNIDKEKLRKVWYTNDKGEEFNIVKPDKFVTDEDYKRAIDFYGNIYCHNLNTLIVKEDLYKVVEDKPQRKFPAILKKSSTETRYKLQLQTTTSDHLSPDYSDLIVKMASSGDFTLEEAILTISHACECCINVLLYKYTCGTKGYPEYGNKWLSVRSLVPECIFCKEDINMRRYTTYETMALKRCLSSLPRFTVSTGKIIGINVFEEMFEDEKYLLSFSATEPMKGSYNLVVVNPDDEKIVINENFKNLTHIEMQDIIRHIITLYPNTLIIAPLENDSLKYGILSDLKEHLWHTSVTSIHNIAGKDMTTTKKHYFITNLISYKEIQNSIEKLQRSVYLQHAGFYADTDDRAFWYIMYVLIVFSAKYDNTVLNRFFEGKMPKIMDELPLKEIKENFSIESLDNLLVEAKEKVETVELAIGSCGTSDCPEIFKNYINKLIDIENHIEQCRSDIERIIH